MRLSKIRRQMAAAVAGLLVVATYTLPASAAAPLATLDIRAEQFAEAPVGNYVYASEMGTDTVYQINLHTLAIEDSFYAGDGPNGMAFSEDGSRLYVANMYEPTISVIDTSNHALINQITLPTGAFDLEVGYGGQLYATPWHDDVRIMKVDTLGNSYAGDFHSVSARVGDEALLQISPDKRNLYFADTDGSLGTVAAYDVSGSEPKLVWTNERSNLLEQYSRFDLGGNGQDLALSNDGQWLTYLTGGGNGVNGGDDNVGVLRTSDFAVVDDFESGRPPSEGVFSPDAAVYYAVHTDSNITMHVLDGDKYLAAPRYGDWPSFRTPYQPGLALGGSKARELYVDPTGRHLFAASGLKVLVFDTGRRVTPEPGAWALAAIALAMLSANRNSVCR
ncbi:MAG: YncE family protein [Planctomycetales bacterium]|nr:YncE family protein [Planctomycetales bacterium]